MGDPCTFCGSDIWRHDPVFVEEAGSDGRVPAGRFCNYACLIAHVDAEGLEVGASCAWSPP